MNVYSTTGDPDRRLPPVDAWDGSPFVVTLRNELARADVPQSSVAFDDMWCHVRPPGAKHPEQGWKLHVSATVDAACGTLARVAEVLLARPCTFKFASTPERLELLNSAHYPRAGSGKFLTVYPPDDATGVELAGALHLATRGRPGPAVLSDRAFAEDSVVYYRYGAFTPLRLLTNDAELQGALVRPTPVPERILVPDARNPWYSPPGWVHCPFPDPPEPRQDGDQISGTGARVLLGGRFAAHEAVRQSSRGGVYRAKDEQTGATVIVKQARAHILGNAGVPAQEALRHEAYVLTSLRQDGHTPTPLALFEQGTDLFLAQQHVPGQALRRWIRDRAGVAGHRVRALPGVPLSEALDVLRRLARAVQATHDAGWVLRDLSPNNVIVGPDRSLTLIDLEFAAPAGDTAPPGGTPGYAAPEQLRAGPVRPESDMYSLGAIAFMLATSVDPVFPPDEPRAPVARRTSRDWLDAAARSGGTAAALAPLVENLTSPRCEDRWSLATVREHLAVLSSRSRRVPSTGGDVRHAGEGVWTEDLARRVLSDGIDHLCSEFTTRDGAASGLWPRACSTGSVDPTNVQHGSAGVIGVLARALACGIEHPELPTVLHAAATWTARYAAAQPRVLPGLHFGAAGTAWALFDAAAALQDHDLAERATALALTVPTKWPNPDLAHGLAGAGTAHLHFWHITGDLRFRSRYRECADRLARRAAGDGTHVRWPIPASFPSRLAGLTHLGYAHGSAGIAGFLLEAGVADGRHDWTETSARAAEDLMSNAHRTEDDCWLWPSAPDSTDPMEHWCSGASGVGTFLLRYAEHTGETAVLRAAEGAARAVHRRRWHAGPVQCHGLAGNGEYLLDLAVATGQQRYFHWARDLARTAFLRRAWRGGRLLVPDETLIGFGAEYGTGMSGFLGFLLRLLHGLDRAWTVRATESPTGLLAVPDCGDEEVPTMERR